MDPFNSAGDDKGEKKEESADHGPQAPGAQGQKSDAGMICCSLE